MMTRSNQVPAFQAASTPIGTATMIENISVTIISDSVGSMRCAIMVVTGRLVKIERPRSACSSRQAHSRELHQERPVEAEALADALDVLRRRLVAGDHRGRVARRDEQQAEHEQRDHHHHRDGRQNTPDDEGEHAPTLPPVLCGLATPQKNGIGPLTMPLTFLRQAW